MGAPRQLWPYLLALTALLFVADVGVRRVRITGPEMRAAYYKVRKRLGYIDAPLAAGRPVILTSPTSYGLVNTTAHDGYRGKQAIRERNTSMTVEPHPE